ncbi:META domain-containing protein [Algoriphagus sp. AK58]|uniref:META domain-containing protein n=1 Tax=Algoriphagus sp. AK58 TaxID=1406877 RepID=UPI0016508BA2|nr:META domain-containing protein [Algoriphagus sp. AK58]
MQTRNVILALVMMMAFSACKSTFPDTKWTNKQWTVVEMLGVPVQTSNTPQDAHLIFNSGEKMVNGNGSCNRIFGPYEIGKRNSLKFGNLASTMMACQNQAFENKYLETLRSVESYQISGGELWLKDSKKRVILKLR